MKAQVSFEFLVVYSALLTIFLVIFAVYFDGSLNLFQTQDKVVALRNAQSAAAAINYVYLAGNGASYKFALTNVMNDENTSISDYTITSKRPHSSASASLLNADVNVSALDKGNMTITNNRGEIDIER